MKSISKYLKRNIRIDLTVDLHGIWSGSWNFSCWGLKGFIYFWYELVVNYYFWCLTIGIFEWQATRNDENNGEGGGGPEEETLEKPESIEPSSTSEAKLYHKLRAVEFEIDAVASTVEQARNVASDEDRAGDGNDSVGLGNKEDSGQVSPNGLDLQHALATDRLRSLKKTMAQLVNELSDLRKEDSSKGVEHNKVLRDMVKEEPRRKRKLKDVQKSGKIIEKKKKIVSFEEDTGFDAILDAASTGFVETVKLT